MKRQKLNEIKAFPPRRGLGGEAESKSFPEEAAGLIVAP